MKKLIFIALLISLALFNSTEAADGFNQDLSFGSSGSEVLKLQEFLAAQGLYSGPITGNFYSLTLRAVKLFQEKEKISPAAGYFGPLTRAKANNFLSADLEASNSQSIAETGTSYPNEVPKTSNDIVASLTAQLNAILAQIDQLKKNEEAQKQTTQAVQTLQTQVQQQTQIIEQQNQTIQQQTQTLQLIQENTTPSTTPEATSTPEIKMITWCRVVRYIVNGVVDGGSSNHNAGFKFHNYAEYIKTTENKYFECVEEVDSHPNSWFVDE